MTRRVRKPKTEAEIAQDTAARAEASRLKAQPDVRVVTDSGGRLQAAQRLDVFAMLHQRRSLTDAQEAAVRRLESDMHIAAGAEGDLEIKEYVQGSGCAQLVTQRMIDAQGRVVDVCRRLRPWENQLLVIMLSPRDPRSALTRWRQTVERLTGAANPSKQAERVVVACEALTDAYAAIDYQPGRARA